MTTFDDDIGPIQPRSETARQFGKTPRTLERWERDPELNFPKHIEINGLKYDIVRRLERFKRATRQLRWCHETQQQPHEIARGPLLPGMPQSAFLHAVTGFVGRLRSLAGAG
jgi:hypothetical protein